MKKKIIIIICSVLFVIAAGNFTFAYYIYSTKMAEQAAAENVIVYLGQESSPLECTLQPENFLTSASSEAEDSGDPLHIGDRAMKRYDIARFIRELYFGTDINGETLSWHFDTLNISYDSIKIISDDNFSDLARLVAMCAVYTDYDIDNITHFENYGRYLWAATHNIIVNGNTYPAALLTTDGTLMPDFYKDLVADYSDDRMVELHFAAAEGNYYELDPNFTWTEDKIAEAEEIAAMPYNRMVNYLIYKNDENLLYSPLPLFNQGSGTWCGVQFGGGTIRSDGCCPSSISMVISYFTNSRITPDTIGTMYDFDEYRSITNGSYGVKMCQRAASDFGLNIRCGSGSLSAEQIASYLEQDAKIVISVKGGDYSGGFHYITLAGITSDGYVIVNNPGYATDITYDTPAKVAANQSGKCYAVFSAN